MTQSTSPPTRANVDIPANIYDPAFVADVFDRCSAGYRNWSAIASFGFIRRWRKACVAGLDLASATGNEGVDLMAGTGEVWPHLLSRYPDIARITAVDISRGMHDEAVERLHQNRSQRITHLCADVLSVDLPPHSADFAISTFGLKTFNADQHRAFAGFLARILKPGAPYSLIEAADPLGWTLRPLYRLYLDQTLPLVEKIALRGAQDFAMLGTYTRNFAGGASVTEALTDEGLAPVVTKYSGGAAVRWHGRKAE